MIQAMQSCINTCYKPSLLHVSAKAEVRCVVQQSMYCVKGLLVLHFSCFVWIKGTEQDAKLNVENVKLLDSVCFT